MCACLVHALCVCAIFVAVFFVFYLFAASFPCFGPFCSVPFSLLLMVLLHCVLSLRRCLKGTYGIGNFQIGTRCCCFFRAICSFIVVIVSNSRWHTILYTKCNTEHHQDNCFKKKTQMDKSKCDFKFNSLFVCQNKKGIFKSTQIEI